MLQISWKGPDVASFCEPVFRFADHPIYHYGGRQDVAQGTWVGGGAEQCQRQGLVPVYQPVYNRARGRTGGLPSIREEQEIVYPEHGDGAKLVEDVDLG